MLHMGAGGSTDMPRNSAGAYQTQIYHPIQENQWPIVYHPAYNISFCGMEKLHPFDAGKWGKIVQFLLDSGMVTMNDIVQPNEATRADLLVVHTEEYINSLNWSANVARVTEVPPVACLPNALVQSRVLKPFRYHVGGTVLAARLALERGWAINIGGGFHHCSSDRGGGFCAYADLTMAIKFLQKGCAGPQYKIHTAMIIDLDAHQGNGHGRDFLGDDSVYILDVYNHQIYPMDNYAKDGISLSVQLRIGVEDEQYLNAVRVNVEKALKEFTPALVVYNAGTDIMEGDQLGGMAISAKGIIERDEIVFQHCRDRKLPIVMVTSGGYQRSNARNIADSILNLHKKKLIFGPNDKDSAKI